MKIFNFDRLLLPNFMPKQSICAEVGVWKGEYSENILVKNNPKMLYLIDFWEIPPMPTDSHLPYYEYKNTQEEFYNVYLNVCNRMKDKQVTIIKEDSISASMKIEDSYLDWVYLDGDHSEEGVYKDLSAYYNKVKPGGYISGHDWNNPEYLGLMDIVLDFCSDKNMNFVGITNENEYSSYILKKPIDN